MFTDAKTVMIGNKEVQSIVTNNGGVLYEKPTGYLFTLATDKNFLSFSNNESATLTATLTENNRGVPDETVQFYSTSSQYVDNCSQTNLSKYDISLLTATYTNNAYDFTLSHSGGGSTTRGVIKLPLVGFSDFSFEAKILASIVQENSEFGLVLSSSRWINDHSISLKDTNGNKYFQLTEGSEYSAAGAWTTNKYYKLVLSLNGNLLTGTIYDNNNNQLFTDSCTLTSSVISTFTGLEILIGDAYPTGGMMSGSVKDIKVTGLNNNKVVENLGAVTTDANGVATKSFVGEAIGDVTIDAECMNFQETVNLNVI